VSAIRINPPGKKPVLIPLGHDEPVRHPDSVVRLMRIPLEDRLASTRRAA
jgi:hypothetical protein